MTDLEELKAELAAERARLEAQDWALTVLEDFMRKLVSHGFEPRLTIPGGMVTVSFDLDRVQSEAGAATEAPDPEETAREPAPDPEPKTGPWSEDEIATATEILRKGGVYSDVARALGRTPSHVGWRCNKISKQLRSEAEAKPDPAVQGSAPAEPAPAAGGSPVPAGSTPVTAPPASARRVQAHLNALGHVAPWSAGLDLDLVERLARGESLTNVAERIGVSRPEAIARWKALLPEVTIDGQRLLLEELRRRAAAQVAA